MDGIASKGAKFRKTAECKTKTESATRFIIAADLFSVMRKEKKAREMRAL